MSKVEPKHSLDPITLTLEEEFLPFGLMPPTFPPEYVAGAVAPFFLAGTYVGETPALPMIDFALSKEQAAPAQLYGLLYEGWIPDPNEGRTLFLTGYENRGPNNERKRIYMTATTPDLIESKYRPKIRSFFERFLAEANAGDPMMQHYFDNYYDLYWDLHLGVSGDQIPAEVREFSQVFSTAFGFFYPTMEIVRDAYMRARELRGTLKTWLDERIQAILDGKQPGADGTFAYYWLKNGEQGENFRRKDLVFECYHNILAFSQWGHMIYNVASKLEPTRGDPNVRTWLEKVMSNGPDEPDGSPFTPLDRLVMELFRTTGPNIASQSVLKDKVRKLLGIEINYVLTATAVANMNPHQWSNPREFDPDRFKTAPLSADDGQRRSEQAGLARCPFAKEPLTAKDGRRVTITNSAFGTAYAEVDGTAYPVVDTAGYAAFGFGYRRCAGEHLTMEFVKEYLRKVWADRITFTKLSPERVGLETLGQVPVNQRAVVNDDIAFRMGK